MEPKKFCFGVATAFMREGRKVRREGWRLAGMHLSIIKGDLLTAATGMNFRDTIVITLPDSPEREGYSYPIQPNMHDLLAEDWTLAD